MRNGAALPAALAGVLTCLAGVLTWQVVTAGPLTAADMPVSRWALRHGLDQSSPLWVGLSELGDGRVALPVLAAAATVAWWRRRALRPVLLAAAGLIVYTAVLEVMKEAIGRAAPGTGDDGAFAGGTAFPSGHASAAAVIWGLTAWLAVLAAARPRAALDPARSRGAPAPGQAGDLLAARRGLAGPRVSRYACLLAGGTAGLASGAAMVRMGYHWVSDVAGGWLLGMLTLLAVLAAARSGRGRRPARLPCSLHGGPLRRNGRRPRRDAPMPEPSRPGRSSPLPAMSAHRGPRRAAPQAGACHRSGSGATDCRPCAPLYRPAMSRISSVWKPLATPQK